MFEVLFQPTHLLVIFGIALLVFGPKKLPEFGKGIGEGIRGFKAAMKAEDEKPATRIANVVADHGLVKEKIVRLGAQTSCMLMSGVLLCCPKRLPAFLGQLA